MIMEPVKVDGKEDGKYIPSRTSQEGYSDFHGVVLKGTPGATFKYRIGENDYTSSSQAIATNTDGNMLGDAPVETWLEPSDDENTNYVLNSGFFKYFENAGVLDWSRAYLKLPTSMVSNQGAGVKALVMKFSDNESENDDPTAIKDIMTTNETLKDNVYYNFQGMRVVNPTRGIYIINGKKIYIK